MPDSIPRIHRATYVERCHFGSSNHLTTLWRPWGRSRYYTSFAQPSSHFALPVNGSVRECGSRGMPTIRITTEHHSQRFRRNPTFTLAKMAPSCDERWQIMSSGGSFRTRNGISSPHPGYRSALSTIALGLMLWCMPCLPFDTSSPPLRVQGTMRLSFRDGRIQLRRIQDLPSLIPGVRRWIVVW